MSFPIICKECGAPSGPSVGVCPYCKSSQVGEHQLKNPTILSLENLYSAGKINEALALATQIERDNKEFVDDDNFLAIYIKILIDSEGPSSKINGLLMKILSREPNHNFAKEYMRILTAKSQLRAGRDDLGEKELRLVLQDSPKNVHALFLLGSHLFWIDKDMNESARLLEICTSINPNMLRAWGCLAAIYKFSKNKALQERAGKKMIELETNPAMKEFIKKEFLN